MLAAAARPIHREDTPSWTPRFASPSSSPRWRWRRTTRSASRWSRSCARACSRRGSARRPDSTSEVRETAYWVALLRYVGCTGHAHEVATLFGDEIAIRAQTLVHDAANPAEVMGDVVAFATAGRSEEERDEIIRMLQETAHEWAVHNFASGCEVADMLVAAARLRPRRPRGARASRSSAGTARASRPTPRARRSRSPMRVVHLSHDMEAIGRLFSPERAARGRPRSPRPHLRPGARRPVRRARARVVRPARARSSRGTPCSTSSPSRAGCSTGEALDRRPDRRRRLHRPEVAVHGRAQPPLRAARHRRGPRARARRRTPSPRSAARRSCTTSAPPPSRTRSGTSPARSRGRSSTASSSTRC